MELKETKQALRIFAKNVVKVSRSNLTKGRKNVSKELYDSIAYDLKVHKNSFSLSFLMEDYGVFQDKGVSGKEKKYNTKFKFKSKMPPREPILKWIKARRLNLRDDKGRFAKGGQKTLAFLIQRSIYNKGIKPSLFFTKPFEKHFKLLPKELTDRFGLDVKNMLR